MRGMISGGRQVELVVPREEEVLWTRDPPHFKSIICPGEERQMPSTHIATYGTAAAKSPCSIDGQVKGV